MTQPATVPAKILSAVDADAALHSLDGLKGILTPGELDGIRERINKQRVVTASQAKNTTAPAPEPQPETTPSRLTALPFAELAAHPALLERGINLQQQLDSHVQMMIDMGIVSENQRAIYAEKFATISVNLDELTKAPKNWRPQLFVDDMTPDQALSAHIKNTQVTVREWTTISNYKKVDPKTKQHLPETQQLPSGLARLTFSSSNTTGKTANYQLGQQVKGINHMQPKQWLQMFMEDLNTAIKTLKLSDKTWKDLLEEEKLAILQNRTIDQFLPDVSTITQFPEYQDENGLVLVLRWNPDCRLVDVIRCDPGVPSGDIGVREVLG